MGCRFMAGKGAYHRASRRRRGGGGGGGKRLVAAPHAASRGWRDTGSTRRNSSGSARSGRVHPSSTARRRYSGCWKSRTRESATSAAWPRLRKASQQRQVGAVVEHVGDQDQVDSGRLRRKNRRSSPARPGSARHWRGRQPAPAGRGRRPPPRPRRHAPRRSPPRRSRRRSPARACHAPTPGRSASQRAAPGRWPSRSTVRAAPRGCSRVSSGLKARSMFCSSISHSARSVPGRVRRR